MSPSERALFAGLQLGAGMGKAATAAYNATQDKGMQNGESAFGYTKQPLYDDHASFLTGLTQGIQMGPQGGENSPMLAMQPQQQQQIMQPAQQLGDGMDLRTQLSLLSQLKNQNLQY